MELATPKTAAAKPLLLLLCLATSGVLQALGQSTAGFISIDCGLPGETGYVEYGTLLPHTTDAGFIDAYAGSNYNVSVEDIVSAPSNMYVCMNTVRSFPSGVRNCYTLGLLGAGLKYLIRAKFFYGNYDGLNKPPTFDLYIGLNFWTTMDIGVGRYVYYEEAIVVLPDDSVQVCLVNTGGGVPFISGLDLRPLKKELYPLANATQGLILLAGRMNFGPTNAKDWSRPDTRYPDDPYDRYWFPFIGYQGEVVISTGLKVQVDDDDQFQPPQPVMQTAITTQNTSSSISFIGNFKSYYPSDRALGYFHVHYFSELEQFSSRSIKNSVEPTNDGAGKISLDLEKRQCQFDDENISLELESRQFTYMELQKITKNFQRQLGRGGFGNVFHGSLNNGSEVAVKLSSHSSDEDVKQFLAEAQVLARIHHKNLVNMIGFCTDREHMALVYEYMPQGTLQEHINIAVEVHDGLQLTTSIYLQVKAATDEAYLGDKDSGSHLNLRKPSTKSDVYSFGVVLLELVTGKPAILRNLEPITIIEWAGQRLAQGDIEGVVDARMQGDYDINAVWKTTEIALKCTERSPLQRPSMTDIVMQLQECLDLEESCMEGDSDYTSSGIDGMNPDMGYNATSQNIAALR
ncbi:unnamed protein product [Alopecurus aequalis]